MRQSLNIFSTVLLMILVVLVAGCATTMDLRQQVPEPNLTRSSSKLDELKQLPKPDRKIVVTVYRFQDKTGQFNDSDRLRYSTAVTQGATSQLITALMRANYFTVVERANLDDLITEQRLKVEKRVRPNTGPEIGKMYGAEYIIAGDITEYNVDVVTGGLGVRVSGAGGSATVAVATAAIDLRIVESTTGRIVFNKSLRKSIIGKQVGLNIFRFWDNRLYEINGGLANQEPIQLAIRELLEEAVHNICTSYAKAYEKKRVALKAKSKKKALAKKKVRKPSKKALVSKPKKAPVKTQAKAKVVKSKPKPVAKKPKTPQWAKDLLQATVQDSVVNVRMGPGLEYKRLFQVQKNQVVYVLEKNLVWNLVKTSAGNQGWIRTDKIMITGGPVPNVFEEPDYQWISNKEGSDDLKETKKGKNLI